MSSRTRCPREVVLGSAWLLLHACAAASSTAAPPRMAPRPSERPASPGHASAGAEQAAAGACPLVDAKRTFVGFAEGMTLEDFELAAMQAEALKRSVHAELCARAPELDPSGELRGALLRAELELFEIVFTSDDASAAEVGLQRAQLRDHGDGSTAHYRLRAALREGRWHVLELEQP